MSFLGTILPQSLKVPPLVKQQRKSICGNCPHMVQSTGTCGTLLLGGTVLHNGFPVKLCGCIINEKTELPGEKCPLGKWIEHNQ